ncbi:MAG: sigma-70 family RNA polymerase sigma factor [Methylotenera sp.]
MQQTELDLWQRYLAKPSAELRDRLVKEYTELVKILAARFYANRQIAEIEFSEFEQYGMVGLIESIDKFDPTFGVSFKSFASHRIKGAMLNGIEKYCEKQQQITMRSKFRSERMRDLLKQASQQQDDIFAKLVDVAVGTAIGYMLEDTSLYQSEEAITSHHAYSSREMHDLSTVMGRLVSALPDQEQRVIRMHYYQQLKFETIANELNLTKSRVSQIHHSALKNMYEHYDELKLLRTEY